jgi:hypothetical protein
MPAPLAPSEQIAHSTVRIEVETADGKRGTGTGFFFSFARQADKYVPTIITNKHVVEGAARGRFHLSTADAEGNPVYSSHEVFQFEGFQRFWISHPDDDIDLCAMPIAPILERANQTGKRLFFIQLDMALVPSAEDLAQLTAMEDILMAGYPNGIWDEKNNMPVLRRGVSATHPNLDWNGKPEFLIDAACFPGSSGSPVFLFNLGGYAAKTGGMVIGSRLKLLGVLYAGPQHTVEGEIRIVKVPTLERPVAVSTIPNNLGIVVKARKLEAFETLFKAKLEEEAKSNPTLQPTPASGRG